MKIRTVVIGVSAAIAIAVASQAGAWMGGSGSYDCGGPMMGRMMYNGPAGPMMGRGPFTLTPEEQAKVDKIRAGYEKKFTAGEKAIREKLAELETAWNDKNTTVSRIETLRRELRDLRQDYWQTRRKFNLEVAEALGRSYYGAGGWGPKYCATGHMGAKGCMMGMGRGSWCRS